MFREHATSTKRENIMATTIKTVNYHLIANPGASRLAQKEVYTARVNIKESYNLAAISERMVAEGCLANASAIELVIKDFATLVAKLVSEGRSVNIEGLVRFAPSIRGTFDSPDAAWNAATNHLVVNATSGARMRLAAAKSSVQRIAAITLPTLEEVIDLVQQRPNTILSNGRFFVIGTRLTWNTSADDEGWFIACNGTESKCTVAEEKQDDTYVVLQATTFERAGLPLELFFRTRIDGILYSIKYENTLTSAVEA